jgi:predicted RNA binding protein YcfA (HicA-like mRNA interferase family)
MFQNLYNNGGGKANIDIPPGTLASILKQAGLK